MFSLLMAAQMGIPPPTGGSPPAGWLTGGRLPCVQVNGSTSQVDCQVVGLALDELELASLRGTVQEAGLHVNFDTRMGRGQLQVAGPRFSGLQVRPPWSCCRHPPQCFVRARLFVVTLPPAAAVLCDGMHTAESSIERGPVGLRLLWRRQDAPLTAATAPHTPSCCQSGVAAVLRPGACPAECGGPAQGEALSGAFRWERDVVRLERVVLEQKRSRYEVQGDYAIPAGAPPFSREHACGWT